MNTHKIEANPVHAGSSPTGKAPKVKLPRMEIPLRGGSGDEPSTGTSDPVEEPSLVVVRSPDPPPGGGEAQGPKRIHRRRPDGLG
jgi:hypothetical protein